MVFFCCLSVTWYNQLSIHALYQNQVAAFISEKYGVSDVQFGDQTIFAITQNNLGSGYNILDRDELYDSNSQFLGYVYFCGKENIDTHTPTGKLMLTMIAAINEFERMNLLERQREGIAIAKRKGIYKGRKPVSISPEEWQAAYSDYCTRKINKVRMANRLGISRTTLDKLLKKV